MKKIIAAALFASVFASVANAGTTPDDVQLTANAYAGIGDVATDINLARQFNILAIANRAGVVKNSFEATLSANVIAGIIDNADNNRIGVVAGSNKGRVGFTGSSVGGSVAQCGEPVAKDVTNLAASLVVADTLDLAEPNGCGL
ncbi:hypothetical protein [Stutzerimonas nitrititolerans]|uniref:hypothetical protein n=1 Tax=Stutzerimonas nitrititolerans TaxID=2482751 RepID=UPI00289BB84A|nr:hypothetical protein [Stutzerimonas nitrititolerans]